MKMKMLALSLLLATACVQAEQIKVPSLEVLKECLKEHPQDCIGVRVLFEDSGFFKEMAGNEVDSTELAARLRGVALALAVRNILYVKNYEFYKRHGIDFMKASDDAGTIAKATVTDYLSVKIKGDSDFGNFVFRHYVEPSSESHKQYRSYVEWLYGVFFQDNQKVLAEELEKFSSK